MPQWHLKMKPINKKKLQRTTNTHTQKKSSATYLGFLTRRLQMKPFASSEMSANSSSGKSTSACVMLTKVSWSVSPPKGVQPVRNTYVSTPTDLQWEGRRVMNGRYRTDIFNPVPAADQIWGFTLHQCQAKFETLQCTRERPNLKLYSEQGMDQIWSCIVYQRQAKFEALPCMRNRKHLRLYHVQATG